MVPKFTSLSDMLGFIRALPANANYAKMLAEDFGVVAPPDALGYQKEYLFKYLVQGTTKGVDQSELMKTAVEGVEHLAKTLPHITWPKENGTFVEPKVKVIKKVSTGTKGSRVGSFDASVGMLSITEKDGKFYGYIGDVLVAVKPDRDSVIDRFDKFDRLWTDD